MVMSKIVTIMGQSGSGKTTSLRNFAPDEICLINVVAKDLPFRGHFDTVLCSDDYVQIKKFLNDTDKKIIVIDDAQYLMSNQFMNKANERGFDKFTNIGKDFWDFVNFCKSLANDVIVYFLIHTEITDGIEKVKTIGKMIDEKICFEGLFTVVLKSNFIDKSYCFETQTNGSNTVKSPIGMFNKLYIPNDLKMVDTTIREYYGLINLPKCSICGGNITECSGRTVQQIVDGTIKTTGKQMCMRCFAKWKKENKS